MPRVTSLNGGIIGADNTPSPTKKITTFTSNGCFNRTVPTAQVVVVAGGGGGSYGGGGAGGIVVTCTDHPLPGSAVPVTVGAGGTRSNDNGCLGGEGNNSVFATSCDPITAKKGMGGGGQVGEVVGEEVGETCGEQMGTRVTPSETYSHLYAVPIVYTMFHSLLTHHFLQIAHPSLCKCRTPFVLLLSRPPSRPPALWSSHVTPHFLSHFRPLVLPHFIPWNPANQLMVRPKGPLGAKP